MQKSFEVSQTYMNNFFLMKTKKSVLTFSDKMQISALSCFATCD